MQSILQYLEKRGRLFMPDQDDIAYRQFATAFFPGLISAVVSALWVAIFFLAAFAVNMLATVSHHTSWNGDPIQLRVGINTGPVVAGVIGRQKFIYDLWGDAVNVASRMESNGLANQIQVTAAVRDRLKNLYDFVVRDPIYVKGKGEMVTYILQPESV